MIAYLNACWNLKLGSTAHKAVLMVLADHANQDGVSWPKVATIARKADLSERTVRTAIASLEDRGLLVVDEQFEKAGKQIQNSYRIVLPTGNSEIRGETLAPLGVQLSHPRGAALAPPTRTTNEPSDKPSTTPAHRVGRRAVESKPKKLVLADTDGSTSREEEPAAFGGDRKPRTSPERKEIARQRGRSGFGLAARLQQGLLDAGVKGATNVSAVTVQINEQRKAGYTWSELDAMVDTFLAAPARYTLGSTAPWKAFLNSIQKIADDNAKITAVAPSAYADDPYADMED